MSPLNSPPPPSPWLTVAESAAYAKRSKNTINLALRTGELVGNQTMRGGIWRIHVEDLDNWIRGHRAPVQPAKVARRRSA